MGKKFIKITQPQQFELVAILKKKPELAGVKGMSIGFSKESYVAQWERIAVELNSFGPPTRTAKEWQRVWIHYKAKLKRKLAKKNTERGSADNNLSLTQMEETVIDLVENAVYQTNKSFSLNQAEASQFFRNDDENEVPSLPLETNPVTILKPTGDCKTYCKTIDEEQIASLSLNTTQTDYKKEIFETLQKMERLMHKNFELKKQLIEIKKKKSAEASELHVINVQLKKRKIAWLGIQMRNEN